MTIPPTPDPASYLASLPFDKRLALYDVQGSIAWARALHRAGVLTTAERDKIVQGLASIREKLEKGTFPFRPELEDIHYNVEARLTERIGPLGGKLHTGRSRNDQIATDLRLYVKDAVRQAIARLKDYQRALLAQAEQHLDTVMPGYTHFQRAQPVLLAHHFLAYVEMAQRDAERFLDAYRRTDVLPLGSAALAGTAYPIDREALAKDLGFSRVSRNSLDAVSDRDFVVEYEAAAALTMAHLSRLAEETVLWSSEEFGFLRVADAYSSGSSIMPQKRNPDIAELARGKTGRVYGHLVGILTLLKGLPLTYNRDLQEDKEGFFDTVDTLLSTLEVFTGMVSTLTVNAERTRQAAQDSNILATDLADYLV
ncbi:MAG: argininosuccinate lyase, partial [Chloroflexi bacterium]|nr:argininosuccinate lyase [Chloroflexota bacterium]